VGVGSPKLLMPRLDSPFNGLLRVVNLLASMELFRGYGGRRLQDLMLPILLLATVQLLFIFYQFTDF